MVIAYHLIWTAYGWWLPNDPRGSTSHFIHSPVIFELGNLHYGRKRVQPTSSEIRNFYDQASRRLKHPLLSFDPTRFHTIAQSFDDTIASQSYTCYACAILPDHVHILIRKHRDRAQTMIANFQDGSREQLRATGLREPCHPIWGGPGWKVFLDSPEDIQRTIPYIEKNPAKLGLPAQKWEFVRHYDNWPFHNRR